MLSLIAVIALVALAWSHEKAGPHVQTFGRGVAGGAKAVFYDWLLLGPGGPSACGVRFVVTLFGLLMLYVVSVALPGPEWVFWVGAFLLVYAVSRGLFSESREWHDPRSLQDVFSDIVKWPEWKEKPLALEVVGEPRETRNGITTTVRLPGALVASELIGKRDAVASRMQVPRDRIRLEEGADPGVLKVTVADSTPEPPKAALPTTTSWRSPITIGMDPMGQGPIAITTHETNLLVGGVPGFGKTNVSRVVLAHYLLDPTTTVWLVDGKGSRRDYGDAVPLLAGYVSGVSENAVEATRTLLGEVLELVRARNTGEGDEGGALLLLEEYQDIRSAASKEDREAMDSTLGRIVRMGRAVSVSVLVSTQRPSVDDLPAGARNLMGTSIALRTRNAQDTKLILGETPEGMALPTRRGEALLRTSEGIRPVRLAHLADEAWLNVVQQAAVVRGTSLAVQGASGDVRGLHDPVVAEVVRILQDFPRGMSAAGLLECLPDDVVPEGTSPAGLGKHLARFPAYVEKGHEGTARVWRVRSAKASVTPLPAKRQKRWTPEDDWRQQTG